LAGSGVCLETEIGLISGGGLLVGLALAGGLGIGDPVNSLDTIRKSYLNCRYESDVKPSLRIILCFSMNVLMNFALRLIYFLIPSPNSSCL
jgi:hypothetical protein